MGVIEELASKLAKMGERDAVKRMARAKAWKAATEAGVRPKQPLYRIVSKDYALDERMPSGAVYSQEPEGRYFGFTIPEAHALRLGDEGELSRTIQETAYNIGEDSIVKLRRGKESPDKIIKAWPTMDSKVFQPKTEQEWIEVVKESKKVFPGEREASSISNLLKQKGYDFVILPDWAGGMSDVPQVVQLRPKKVTARLGSKTKVLGLAGALGVGGEMLKPQESEASPALRFQAYRRLLESVIKEGYAKDLRGAKKWASRLREQIKAIHPRAFESDVGMPIDEIVLSPTMRPKEKGYYIEGQISLNPKGRLGKTHALGHEVGHHIQGDPRFFTYEEDIGFTSTNPALEKINKRPYSFEGEAQTFARVVAKATGRPMTESESWRATGIRPEEMSKKEKKWYRQWLTDPKKLSLAITALGGGMGILDLLEPSEAQAMPRGVFRKLSSTVMKGEVSSAAKVLVGKQLENKTIKDVRKGEGNWRAIIFDDDTMMTVTNQELTDLSRAYGTKSYTQAYKEKDLTSQAEQAIKSLDYHYARSKPVDIERDVVDYHQKHNQRLKEMGLEAPKHSLIFYKGRLFTMPKQYAKYLDELGLIQVKKDIE